MSHFWGHCLKCLIIEGHVCDGKNYIVRRFLYKIACPWMKFAIVFNPLFNPWPRNNFLSPSAGWRNRWRNGRFSSSGKSLRAETCLQHSVSSFQYQNEHLRIWPWAETGVGLLSEVLSRDRHSTRDRVKRLWDHVEQCRPDRTEKCEWKYKPGAVNGQILFLSS